MGIGNRTLPALTGGPTGTFARPRQGKAALEGPPVVDLAGNAAAARAAAAKVRQKATTANKPTTSAAQRAPGLVLTPAPGAWRLY